MGGGGGYGYGKYVASIPGIAALSGWKFPVYVTGPIRWSLGASLVPSYWQVRVFGTSDIVDRPSDHLYLRTINLPGCMYRCSHYIPFYY